MSAYLTRNEEDRLAMLLEAVGNDTLHCWVATRLEGRSASLNCDGANIALLHLFDRVRNALAVQPTTEGM